MITAQIKRILLQKGITHLYHVNTVATAITFLENGGLFSRGAIEDLGLFQTPQITDQKDKELDVFYDIFFDSVDIHDRIKTLNHYGPVVFVYSIDVLDSLPSDCIQITKDNPKYWSPSMSENEKYFLSVPELQLNFARGNFAQHITLRHQNDPLPFTYLEKIIIDNPGIDNTAYFEKALFHLNRIIRLHLSSVPLEIRNCPPNCKCKLKYRSYNELYTYHKFKTDGM